MLHDFQRAGTRICLGAKCQLKVDDWALGGNECLELRAERDHAEAGKEGRRGRSRPYIALEPGRTLIIEAYPSWSLPSPCLLYS